MSFLSAVGFRSIDIDIFTDWWQYRAPLRAYVVFDHGLLVVALWPGHGTSVGYDAPHRWLVWEPVRLRRWRATRTRAQHEARMRRTAQ